MIHPWHDLPPGPHLPDHITAVIEIPSGSRNKYELDKATGLFRRPFVKVLPVPGRTVFAEPCHHE